MSAPSFDPAVWASCELAKRVLLGIDAIVPNPLLLLEGSGGVADHPGHVLRLRPGSLALFCFARYLRLSGCEVGGGGGVLSSSPLADMLDQETWDALVVALTTRSATAAAVGANGTSTTRWVDSACLRCCGGAAAYSRRNNEHAV
jgi:hypothetical protein